MPSNRPSDIGGAHQGGKRALQQMLPAGWRFAHQTALDLISQMEHLAWRDRADAFDVYFTQQADGMLGANGVSSMVGGRLSVVGDAANPAPPNDQAASFATWCRAITTAVMIDLDQNQDRPRSEPGDQRADPSADLPGRARLAIRQIRRRLGRRARHGASRRSAQDPARATPWSCLPPVPTTRSNASSPATLSGRPSKAKPKGGVATSLGFGCCRRTCRVFHGYADSRRDACGGRSWRA